MIRPLLVFSLTSLLVLPARAQEHVPAAVHELQCYMSAGAPLITVSNRVRTQYRPSLVPTGCNVDITMNVQVGRVPTSVLHRVDLSRLSPEVVATADPSNSEEWHAMAIVRDGEEGVTSEMEVLGMRQPVRAPGQLSLRFAEARVAEGARLLAEAVTACGGRVPSTEERARFAARQLHDAGNDAETFPLKTRCLEAIGPSVPAGTTLPTDSSLVVSRGQLFNAALIQVSGPFTEGRRQRHFSCIFLREGETWVTHSANVAPEAPRERP